MNNYNYNCEWIKQNKRDTSWMNYMPGTNMAILFRMNSVWYGTIRDYMLQYDTLWYNTRLYATIGYDMVQYEIICYRTIWYNTIRDYMLLKYAAKILDYMLQFDMIWYNTRLYATIRYDMVQYDDWHAAIRYLCHNTIWYDTIRYYMLQHDMIWYNTILLLQCDMLQFKFASVTNITSRSFLHNLRNMTTESGLALLLSNKFTGSI